MKTSRPRPMTFGLFEKRIEGDDCLLELAQVRFQRAGMGAEFYATTPEELGDRLKYCPSAVSMAHLARNLNLLESRSRILEFASRHSGTIRGYILHDSLEMARRPAEYAAAARELNARLESIPDGPTLYIEYAAGLSPGEFVRFFESIASLGRISACIDIGHVGIGQVRSAYGLRRPGEDVCALKGKTSAIPDAMEDVQLSLEAALPAVLEMIRALGALGKPIHYHLHDGHPLSVSSRFGVSDHLSFLDEIPLGFEFRGRRFAPPMFGPAGLGRIVGSAVETGKASFTLEIHPVFNRLALGDYAPYFVHWRDKAHAEQMNHWLWTLERNHALLREMLDSALLENSKKR